MVSLALGKNIANLVQDTQPEPPPECPVDRRIVPVALGNVVPPAGGSFPIEDPVQGAAGIASGPSGGRRRIVSFKQSFDASPGAVADLPPEFLRAPVRGRAPVGTSHTMEI